MGLGPAGHGLRGPHGTRDLVLRKPMQGNAVE